MKIIVRFSARQEVKALPILLRHSPGMGLPKRTYVIAEEAALRLRDAGIKFIQLTGEVK